MQGKVTSPPIMILKIPDKLPRLTKMQGKVTSPPIMLLKIPDKLT
jgi:hypothetical protein